MTRSCRSKPHRTSLKDPHVVMVLPASKLKINKKGMDSTGIQMWDVQRVVIS